LRINRLDRVGRLGAYAKSQNTGGRVKRNKIHLCVCGEEGNGKATPAKPTMGKPLKISTTSPIVNHLCSGRFPWTVQVASPLLQTKAHVSTCFGTLLEGGFDLSRGAVKNKGSKNIVMIRSNHQML